MAVTTTLGASLVLVPPPALAESDDAVQDGPIRVLAVGDSVTHAHAGEYSWRRFAWQEWRRQGVEVDMVGPNRAPYLMAGGVGPAVYADPDFDQDHAGVWGARVSYLPTHDVDALVRDHRPDVLVLALGTNDLVWVKVPPATVADAVDWRIYAARLVNPRIHVVLAEVVAPRNESAVQYNALLKQLAQDRDMATSRVTVAETTEGFVPGTGLDRGGDTYDQLHPNSVGQAKYGAAVVDAFARIGVGAAAPRPIVLPKEGPRSRPRLRATGGATRVDLSWSRPTGSTSTDVLYRRPGRPWRTAAREHRGAATSIAGLVNCSVYEVSVAARRGWNRALQDRWATPVRVKAGGKVARLGVGAVARRGRTVRVRWAKDPSACSYRVAVAVTGRKTQRFSTSSVRAVVRQVPASANVRVTVRAVGAQGKSKPREIRVPRD